jgi:hypothetical protein
MPKIPVDVDLVLMCKTQKSFQQSRLRGREENEREEKNQCNLETHTIPHSGINRIELDYHQHNNAAIQQ